jgi:hypothetical protein
VGLFLPEQSSWQCWKASFRQDLPNRVLSMLYSPVKAAIYFGFGVVFAEA